MSTAPHSVLALVVSRIGDTLLGTPALRAIKETWPECRLTVIAHPGRLPLLAGLPWIDALLPWRPWRRWTALLPGAARYDLAFVFHPDRRQLDFARRSAGSVVAEAVPGIPPSEHLLLPALPAAPMVAVEQRLRLVRAAGADSSDQRLAYVVSANERKAAQARLAALGVAGHRPLVALQLKSFPTKAHRDWPADSFAGLVDGLAARFPGARFIVTGDAGSAADAIRLGERCPGRVASLAGQCDLRETAAVLAEMDLYVGVDTGPTHLAGALGIPMVALYHAAYPGRYLAPRQHPRCRVIEHPRSGAADARQASMADIPVDAVLQAAAELLAAGGPEREAA
ncbi:MAG: glycosyltransferase family 9 protein [Betaproteobacteria bacterium]|nr:glycosyltransferase family 9 protein [Betaproteobacteria bacterium]